MSATSTTCGWRWGPRAGSRDSVRPTRAQPRRFPNGEQAVDQRLPLSLECLREFDVMVVGSAADLGLALEWNRGSLRRF